MEQTQLIAILLTLLIAVFAIWIWIALKRRRIDMDSAGKIRATVFTTTGKSVSTWVRYDGKVCYLRLENGKLIPSTPPSQMETDNTKKRKKETSSLLSSGMYFFDSDCIVKEQYPYETGVLASLLSKEIGRVYWYEGVMEPISNRNMPRILEEATQIASMPTYEAAMSKAGMIYSPALLTAFSNQNTTQIVGNLEEQIREYQEMTITMTKKFVNPLFVFICCGLSVAGLATTSVSLYFVLDKLDLIRIGVGV